MSTFSRIGKFAAAVALVGALAAPAAFAQDEPSATIHFHGGSVAFIAGVNWGDGRLDYKGREIPLQVSGLSVGAIGVTSYDVVGDVYHLHHLRDIEGTFAAVNASATAGPGAGVIDMQNGAGVEIRAHSTSAGLALSLGPNGVQIRIKH
jgi:hypothetical protein